MKRSRLRLPLLVFLVFGGFSLVPAPDARPQANPGTMRYYFLFQARDEKGNKLYADPPKNTKPIIADEMREVAKARWDPDLPNWNDRYTKGPKKLKVENAQLPAGEPDFPFSIGILFPGPKILIVKITDLEEAYLWASKYYDKTWEHSARARDAQFLGSYPAPTFNNNCYGYATDYLYMLSAKGLEAIVDDDGYTSDKTLFCKMGTVNQLVKFNGDHCVWIAKCCAATPCEGKETLEDIRERFACSQKIQMKWLCDKKTGGGKLKDVATIHYK